MIYKSQNDKSGYQLEIGHGRSIGQLLVILQIIEAFTFRHLKSNAKIYFFN